MKDKLFFLYDQKYTILDEAYYNLRYANITLYVRDLNSPVSCNRIIRRLMKFE